MSTADQQQRIIDHVATRPVTVVGAGAGVGKTRVLVATVEDRIAAGVAVNQFAVITFTNVAADEVRGRLLTMVRGHHGDSGWWAEQDERASAMFTGTIHAYAAEMLRSYGYEVGIPRNVKSSTSSARRRQSILDAFEYLLLSGGVSGELRAIDLQHHQLVNLAATLIDTCETRGSTLDGLLSATKAQPDDDGRRYRVAVCELLADAEARYEATKRTEGFLDANDIVLRFADLLDGPAGDAVAKAGAQRWPNLLVDEFQDTDVVQYRILSRLAPHLERLVVVGDPKQAVYAWRAANPHLLRQMAADHHVDMLPLRTANRPRSRILVRAQNALFHGMRDEHPALDEPLDEPDQLPAVDPPDRLTPIVWLQVQRAQQAAAVADHVRALLQRSLPGTGRRVLPGDIVVLTRSNDGGERIARELDDALGLHDISVRFERGDSLYTTPAVVATYRMLRLLLEPQRNINVALASRTPYLADCALDEVIAHTMQHGDPDGRALADALEGRCPDVADRIADLARAVRTLSAPELLARLYDAFDIYDRYRTAGQSAACEHLDLLREAARNLFRQQQALTLPVFTDYLEEAIATGRTDVPLGVVDGEVVPPHIRVMTVHRAKGLQFPVVVIPGMTAPVDKATGAVEAFIDDHDSLQLMAPLVDGGTTESSTHQAVSNQARDARIDEEFRILYVAVTRAQHQVVLVGDYGWGIRARTADGYTWRDGVAKAWADVQAVS